MRVKLSIYVTYDEDHIESNQDAIEMYYRMRQQLHDAAEHLYDNGLLTGDADITISECTHEVILLPQEGESQ